MTVELATWLDKHRVHVLEQWGASLEAVRSGSSYATTAENGDVLVHEPSRILLHLESLYEGLIQAAQHNHDLLSARLNDVVQISLEQPANLPDMLYAFAQLRRIIRDELRHADEDRNTVFDLIDTMSVLLDHAIDIVSRCGPIM
ncbi:MAG: hypothetical protein HC876_01990 [Chloroflexaceae bacterium]|nr:hypothetical protein [Chloroflexaceae bacterium]